MATYRCKRCNFLYIDEKRDVPFEELDGEVFKCPRCRASIRLFEKLPKS